MTLPSDVIKLDNLPSDVQKLDTQDSNSKIDLRPQMQDYLKGAQDTASLAMQGLLKSITGKGIEDRLTSGIPSTQNMSIPDMIGTNAKKAALSTIGQAGDMVTSPLALIAGGAGILNKTPGDILSKINPFGNKIKQDFVDRVIFPKAQKLTVDTVNNFDKPVQNYLIDKGVPKQAVDHIAELTPKTVKNMAAGAENTDPVVLKIQSDLGAKQAEIDKAYSTAMNNVSNDTSINTPDTYQAMGDFLKKYGYIKQNGAQNPMAMLPSRNPVLEKINNLYQTMKPSNVLQQRLDSGQLGLTKQELIDTIRNNGEYRPDALSNIAKKLGVSENDVILNNQVSKKDIVGALSKLQQTRLGDLQYIPINKYQWNLFRNELSNVRNSDQSLSGEVTNILDSLHNDAESAGLKGINNARSLARDYFQHQDLFDKFNQSKLDNIFKQKGEDLRNLRQLGNYTGSDYESMAKNIVANKYLTDKISPLLESPSLGNKNPPIYSTLREMTDKPSTFKKNSRLISDLTGDTPQTKDLLKNIKNLNRNEFIRKSSLGALGIAGGAGILTTIGRKVVNPVANQISDAVSGGDNQ